MKNMFISPIVLSLLTLVMLTFNSFGQNPKRVLFLGNSYTQVNNLPQILADVAASVGDSVFTDRSTPGGYTLQLHSSNSNSLEKIRQGGWDMVVLQEQSQLPSFPIEEVITDVFPYARLLDSLINRFNPCGETVFYRTWGRKNGDASNCSWWPPVCTYVGMDSLLQLRYMMMADSNNALVSPVGAVWKYIRQNFPDIELYSMDESHPSQAGSYAAACCFYTTLYRKNPMLIEYDYTLSEADADRIHLAVKEVVFDYLSYWHIGEYDPLADFVYVSDELAVTFNNLSYQAVCFTWDFGDGQQSDESDPIHYYTSSGNYEVQLVAMGSGYSDTVTRQVAVVLTETEKKDVSQGATFYPNPVTHELCLDLPRNEVQQIILMDESGIEQEVQFIADDKCIKADLTQLTSGFYILLLETEGERSLFKVIKR